jgi:hypothetical protein
VELIKTQVIQILKINFGSTIQPVKDAKVVETERVSEDEKTVIPETPKVAVSVETEKHSSTDQLDIIDDEDLFNGFCEPFTEQDVSKNIVNSAPPLPPTPQPFDGGSEKIVSIGSEEWRKGIAKDSSGRIVHVSCMFRFLKFIFKFIFLSSRSQ